MSSFLQHFFVHCWIHHRFMPSSLRFIVVSSLRASSISKMRASSLRTASSLRIVFHRNIRNVISFFFYSFCILQSTFFSAYGPRRCLLFLVFCFYHKQFYFCYVVSLSHEYNLICMFFDKVLFCSI